MGIGKRGNLAAGFGNALVNGIGVRDVVIGGGNPRELARVIPGHRPRGTVDHAVLVQADDVIGGIDRDPAALGIGGEHDAVITHRDLADTLASAQPAAGAVIGPIDILDGGIRTLNAHNPVIAVRIGNGEHLVRAGLDGDFAVPRAILVPADHSGVARGDKDFAGGKLGRSGDLEVFLHLDFFR